MQRFGQMLGNSKSQTSSPSWVLNFSLVLCKLTSNLRSTTRDSHSGSSFLWVKPLEMQSVERRQNVVSALGKNCSYPTGVLVLNFSLGLRLLPPGDSDLCSNLCLSSEFGMISWEVCKLPVKIPCCFVPLLSLRSLFNCAGSEKF